MSFQSLCEADRIVAGKTQLGREHQKQKEEGEEEQREAEERKRTKCLVEWCSSLRSFSVSFLF